MNRLGMVVDLAHVSPKAMHDTLDVTTAPVVWSHSNAYSLCDHPRNVPDSVLPAVKANGRGGMVVLYAAFLDPKLREHGLSRTAQKARLDAQYVGNPDGAAAALEAWDAANPPPQTPIGIAADHIDHLKKTIGVDHIGIGGDYDGMDATPVGLEDVTGYPRLFAELARRGYTQA
eukprot:gene1106-1390_t